MNSKERTILLRLLKDFEDSFGVTLGDWDTETFDLELNPGSRPFNSKYYPVSIINKENFRKYLKRLVEIGVLTPVQHSQYGTPVFIIPKKEGNVRFITDYCRLYHQLVRKTYPLPRICNTMQKLEGFQYAISLYINMGYNTIRLSPASQYMTRIVT